MRLTWKQAKDFLSQYAGRGALCPTTPDKIDLFVRSVLEYMLISGSYGNIRKFCFCAVKGCITLPYELEVPLKVKIDGQVGSVWDKWFEYHSAKNFEEAGCTPAQDALFEDPNEYPTVYDLPATGAQVGVLGTCYEAEDAHVIIQGVDTSGREVFSVHKGQKISGEYLSIQKGNLRFTSTTFAKITGVVKTKTNGYVELFWVREAFNQKGFLSDYSPLEERPFYRRIKLRTKCDNFSKISIIGRIRLKSAYADTDYIPFDTLYTLQLAAQAINASYNDNTENAIAKDGMMTGLINRENAYKKVNVGQPVEVLFTTSGGSIKNII